MERPVEFKLGEETLRGMVHVPEKGCPAVMLCHGFTGSRTESHFLFVKTSRALARAGIGSLRFDFRGSGESDGEFRQMTILTEIEDARAGLDFLSSAEGFDTSRLGVLGLSMGGCVAASISDDERVRSLVLWSAVARFNEVISEKFTPEAKRMLDELGWVDFGAHIVSRAFFEARLKADPLGPLSRSRAPVLIVCGENDETVPVEEARIYEKTASARGVRTKLHIVKEADHTYARAEKEREVIGLTVDWFRETLA